MDFIKQVIEGREYGKFVFTRHLSKVLQLIGELGEQYHFQERIVHISIFRQFANCICQRRILKKYSLFD